MDSRLLDLLIAVVVCALAWAYLPALIALVVTVIALIIVVPRVRRR